MKQSAISSEKLYWERPKKRRSPEHPVIRAFSEPKVRYLAEVIGNNQNGSSYTLLDVGCGNGFFTYYFRKLYDTYAVDFSEFMLKNNTCRRKVCGSAIDLPFNDNSFDVSFCSNLLHHIIEHEKAIIEMKRVSRKYVVLSEPNRNNPLMFMFGILDKAERGTLKFSLSYMKKLIKRMGLTLIRATTIGLILPNRTPKIVLPLLRMVDGEFRYGLYNLLVCEKTR